MTRIAPSWEFAVERGPDWLFVRPLGAPLDAAEAESLAEEVWSLLEQNFTHRLVLELDQIGPLQSSLIGQLMRLYKRILTHGGLMRICGLSAENQEVLRTCRLDGHFPRFTNRTAAVMSCRPLQPR